MGERKERLPTGATRLRGFDYQNPEAVYFVTLCTDGRRPVFSDANLALSVIGSLEWHRANRGVQLYAYCLMPDHLHLLLRSSGALGQLVRSLKTFTTRSSTELGYADKLWQDDYYDHILRRSEDARSIATYILENPVRAGLVNDASAYQWSGLPDPM